MLRDFIVNTSILISSLFIGHQLFQRALVTPSSPTKFRFLYGVGFGLLGMVLIDYHFQVTHKLIVDLRFVPLMLSALYGGYLSAAVTTVMLLIGRVLLYDYSVVAVIATLFVGIGSGLIVSMRISVRNKWIYMNVLHFIASIIAFSLLIENRSLLFVTYLYYAGAYLIAGNIAFYLVRYLRRLTEMFKQFEELSTKDFLTGLNNFRQFDLSLNELSRKAAQFQGTLSLIAIDIDYFKRINDTYGHPVGDEVLKQLSEILSKNGRFIDVVSRNGGEEFSILLPECAVQESVSIAERVRLAAEKHSFRLPDGSSIHLTISLGVATYPDTVANVDELVKQADNALYKAKQSGRNQVCTMVPIQDLANDERKICAD